MRLGWSVMLLVALVAKPSLAERNARDLEGAPPVAPEGSAIDSATIDVEIVNGCYAISTGTVTASGGGTVVAQVLVYDEGVLIDADPIELPANGSPQAYCSVYQQLTPAGGGEVAIGIWDEPDGTAFDFETVFISEVCTGPAPHCAAAAPAIPTISGAGVAVLALLLAAGAFALLRRRRAPIA